MFVRSRALALLELHQGALPLLPVDSPAPARSIRNGEYASYTQDLASNLGLKIVGAYIDGDGRQFIDFEELNSNLFQVPAHFSDHQGSGEAQLTWTTDLVKAVGGVFYMDSTAAASTTFPSACWRRRRRPAAACT